MGRVTVDPVFILTLKLDSSSFDRLQALRQRHFPPALNWLPAHLTLLHTLSLSQVVKLKDAWCHFETRPQLPMMYARLGSLGRGVAITVDSTALAQFRTCVMETIEGPFTRQDLAIHRAHVTIQNKVDPATARMLLEELMPGFTPWSGWEKASSSGATSEGRGSTTQRYSSDNGELITKKQRIMRIRYSTCRGASVSLPPRTTNRPSKDFL